jgi:hypothetical protein
MVGLGLFVYSAQFLQEESIGLFKNEEIFSKFLFVAYDVWKKNVFGD